MKPSFATFVVLPLLTWFSVANRVFGYYGDQGYSEEGSGYYYQTQTAQYGDGASCDFVTHISYKEVFPIYSFPPEGQQAPASPWARPLSYQHGGHVPRQCIWEFRTRKEDDCVLEFHVRHFRAGHPNCAVQQLLIGDEYGEMRVCENARPPVRFRSSGKKLFLGSFRKNEYKNTDASVMSGEIRCVRLAGRRVEQTHETGPKESLYYRNNSDGGCPAPAPEPLNCTTFDRYELQRISQLGFARMSLVSTPSLSVPIDELRLRCRNEDNFACFGQTKVCYQISPTGCNISTEVAVIRNPMNPDSNTECVHAIGVCGQEGNCVADGKEGDISGDQQIVDVECPAPPGQTCTFGVALCIFTQPT